MKKQKWTLNDILQLKNCRIIDPVQSEEKPEEKLKLNKYFNVVTETGGIKYDSKFEAQYAHSLILRKMAGEIKDWERQVVIPIILLGEKICIYKMDFVLHHLDGRKEYVEIKGMPTRDWKLKYKLFRLMMKHKEPEAILTVIYKKDAKHGKQDKRKRQ
ncbi:MAG TPA: DUF1064 domain-containing protein [Ignavibacteriales bacterium]|nr:DUF1064 domain-containing protein [Ignavibacteriales bacterium]